MQAFKIVEQIEHHVYFEDPEKAKTHFIEDDTPGSWRNTFYSFDKLEAMIPQLIFQIQNEQPRFMRLDGCFGCSVKFLEGFGRFERVSNDTWELQDDYSKACGKIYIVEESNEVEYTTGMTPNRLFKHEAQG